MSLFILLNVKQNVVFLQQSEHKEGKTKTKQKNNTLKQVHSTYCSIKQCVSGNNNQLLYTVIGQHNDLSRSASNWLLYFGIIN